MQADHSRRDDPLWVDWANECVWYQGEPVRLTPKAFAVLRLLMTRAGQLVPKADLLQTVWPEVVVREAVLTGCIGELRKALGETARTPHYIQTVHRRGYRFVGPVRGPAPGRWGPPSTGAWPLEAPPRALPPLGSSARHGSAPRAAALVGRVAELAQLHQWLEQARCGTRQVVFVTGEPGIGKTTVVQAFVEQVAAAGGVGMAQGQCLNSHGAGEPYLPVLDALGRLGRGCMGEQLLAILEQQAPTWLVQMPALLSAAAFEAVQRKAFGVTRERMLREMAGALETFTRDYPLVLVLEDLHWSDTATLALLSYLARRPEPARLLLLGTYRPVEVIVREHPLKALKQDLEVHGQCTELPLELLSAAEVGQYLAARFAAGAPLAAPFQTLAWTLHQRTDGNPLFLVAVVDDLVRRGVVGAVGEQWEVQAEGAAALRAIPESLRRMMAQQCDDLPPQDQQILEAASVTGSTCSTAAVAAGLEVGIEEVEARCAGLARRHQFLEASGLEHWPDGTVAERYRWRHTLYQEVVYDRLPAGRRWRLHRRIGARLETGYGEQAGTQAAALAEHFICSQDAPRAVPYFWQAAQNALHRYGYQEAISHLSQALAVLLTLPATPARDQQELRMQMTLGVALMTLQGYSAPDVARAYTRAHALSQHAGETPELFPALWGLWAWYFVRGALQTACEVGEQLLALAHRIEAPGLLLEAYLALGATFQHLGELGRARTLCEQALTVAQTVDHTYSLALAHFFAAWCAQLRRDPPATATHAAAALTLAQEHAFHYLAAMSLVFQGWAVAMQGQATEGIAQMRQGLAVQQAVGAEINRPLYLTLLAEAYGRIGQVHEGLQTLTEALAIVQQYHDHFYEAELYRLQGEILGAHASESHAAAEASLHQALAISQHQAAKAFELRAAMSLIRLWQQQGRRHEAYNLLAPIYDWFTEGFDTPNLQEAKALLEELEG